MRKDFDRDYIEEELKNIDGKMEDEVNFYMLGGGAMSFRGLKAATKDVDGVVKTREEFDLLKRALKNSMYGEIEVSEIYQRMKSRQFLQNEEGFRFDLFLRKIANGLILSDGMVSRAEKKISLKNLKIFIMSPEDIFVLKSITSRERDREDMNILFTQGLDFDVIKEEIILQSEKSTDKAWISYFYLGLEEFVDMYGFEIPYFDEFEELASREIVRYRVKELLDDEPMNMEKLVEHIGEDEKWIEDILIKMEEDCEVSLDENGKIVKNTGK
ncbi:MAG: DUF6036 family nucleotidyltransferase [Thermoplasmata archaeon]